MSKQEPEDVHEDTVTFVYLPDEGVYGTVIHHGAWVSLIEYYESGVGYTIEVSNDDFIVLDEVGIGYTDETENDL